MSKENKTHPMVEEAKTNIYSIFFRERDGQLSKLDVGRELEKELVELTGQARISVLRDFDNMCKADAFVGFTDVEWLAIKKFFDFNKATSGWDKDEKHHE